METQSKIDVHKGIIDLYDRLDKIFVKYTTHNWKNQWPHEKDIDDTSYDLKIYEENCNLFLLTTVDKYKDGIGLNLESTFSFKIEVHPENDNTIRVDIEYKHLGIDIFYYVSDYINWEANCTYLIDLCTNVYNSSISLRESFNETGDIYGDINPDFIRRYKRNFLLEKLEIE